MTVLQAYWFIIWDNRYVTWMLISIPFAFASYYTPWSPIATFILTMLGIIPLAKLLGTATEELALRTSETVGGLLNATFGNAVELIVSIIALSKGTITLVQTSLLGSILSNILLVMGMSFLFGGIKHKTQTFNRTASLTSSSLLFMSVMGLIIPATFSVYRGDLDKTLAISRITAIVLLIIYISYLSFQLKTHKELYEDEGALHEDEDEEVPILPLWAALVLLAGVTVLVALLADYLVDAINEVVAQHPGKISLTFIGIILVPIVGNAAEHVTAVTVAMKNKMDLSLGVALGSSIQIALLVIPLLVILGWIIDQPMTLDFDPFSTVVLFITVIIVNVIISDGSSNWLEGAMLMATYIVIAAAFAYFP